MTTPEINAQDIWNALGEVKDPEIPIVSVVEMGIVRQVELVGSQVTVSFTPTFSGCPALAVIREDISVKLRALGFEHPDVKTVLSPAWTTDWISEEARQKLKDFGIAPPAPAEGELIQLAPTPTTCPRCDSLDVSVKNTFGSTLCKAIYVCNSCQEPFEAFKSI